MNEHRHSLGSIFICKESPSSLFFYKWLFFSFFFLRKISPELTSANPPLFAEEDWP